MSEENEPNRHAGSGDKVPQNSQPPSKDKVKKPKVKRPVSVTESQSMAYVTLKNIESETSYLEQDWSLFVIKELLDNAWDWLNDEYPITNNTNNKDIRKIVVRLWLTRDRDKDQPFFIHIAVRNSNVNNKSVFTDLGDIFNFRVWHGTKRYQHRMTTGSLGDALKRCLGMGYASWTKDYDPNEAFEDKQWNEPLIVRCNGQEFKIFIKVDIARSTIDKEIKKQETKTRDIGTDTEVEVTLPISDEETYRIPRLQEYYKKYTIGKLKNTEFRFIQPETQMYSSNEEQQQ